MAAPEMQPSGWVPFDEQRYDTDLKRADIIFGPDMFDPRIIDGYTPLSDALEEAVLSGKLEDLGIPRDALSKTVGEVYGDMSPQERRERMFEVSRRLEVKPPVTPQRKGFLGRVLSFAR
jgi:hypothetical protein